jgi:hypothetical protein
MRTAQSACHLEVRDVSPDKAPRDLRKPPRQLQSNFSPRTPKHQGKPRSTRDQRARRYKIENPAKSAKPPSRVQIRAAPPKSFGKSAVLFVVGTIRAFADGRSEGFHVSITGSACGVVAHGRYTIAWADQYRRLTVTLLRCVKLSSMPSREYSRPIPLCLKPP